MHTIRDLTLRTAARCHALLLRVHRDERGYTSETVLVTALLVAAALVIVGIIVAKITGVANSIQTS